MPVISAGVNAIQQMLSGPKCSKQALFLRKGRKCDSTDGCVYSRMEEEEEGITCSSQTGEFSGNDEPLKTDPFYSQIIAGGMEPRDDSAKIKPGALRASSLDDDDDVLIDKCEAALIRRCH